MLNIITLQWLRKKSTWPSKVAKNLMKWLDLIWEPYIINWDPQIFKNILILDDDLTFRGIGKLPRDADILAWPNLENKSNILPENLKNKYRFIYPSNWIKKIGDKYKYHENWIVRPVWIDTYKYLPSNIDKRIVTIYTKWRKENDIQYCKDLLKNKQIEYRTISYDKWYKEKDFLSILDISKYVIWIWKSESQGIALEEILSKKIPVIVWDIRKFWDRIALNEFEKKYYMDWDIDNEYATSAEYFDETCWIRFYDKEDLEKNIEKMEDSWDSAYTPRKYIENNLSLEKQAKEMLSFYSDPSRWNNIKKKKYLRNNLLLKLGWIIIDSKLFSIFYKPLVSLYQKISIKK